MVLRNGTKFGIFRYTHVLDTTRYQLGETGLPYLFFSKQNNFQIQIKNFVKIDKNRIRWLCNWLDL